jgi:outer membrane usher protein FimD/PapC
VTGISRSGGKVTISQQGRVLYETQVAAGPFRIQELNDAVSGTLDVRVEELDGSVQVFQDNGVRSLSDPSWRRALQAGGR